MNVADVWRNVSDRIGFFTKETSQDIPEGPGCYAWFLPLWIYTDDLRQLVTIVNKLQLYDPKHADVGWREANLDFVWDSLAVRAARCASPRSLSTKTVEDWERVLADPVQRDVFERALMEATIMMPPLYVGKTDGLRDRYDQHVRGVGQDANIFHSRFTAFADKLHLPLAVSDLLFMCVRTDTRGDQLLRDARLNYLLESVMKLLCRPPFGIR